MRGYPFALFVVATALGLFFARSYYNSFGINYLDYAAPLDLLFTWLANIDKLFFVLLLLVLAAVVVLVALAILLVVSLALLSAALLLLAGMFGILFAGRSGLARVRWIATALGGGLAAKSLSDFVGRYRAARLKGQEDARKKEKTSDDSISQFLRSAISIPKEATEGIGKRVGEVADWLRKELTQDGRLMDWKEIKLRTQALICTVCILLLIALFVLAYFVGEYEADRVIRDVETLSDGGAEATDGNSAHNGSLADGGVLRTRVVQGAGNGYLEYALGLVGHTWSSLLKAESDDVARSIRSFVVPTSNLAALEPCQSGVTGKLRKYVRATIRQDSGTGGRTQLPNCLIHLGATETAQFLVDMLPAAEDDGTKVGERKCELVGVVGPFVSGRASMEICPDVAGNSGAEDGDGCGKKNLVGVSDIVKIVSERWEAGLAPVEILLVGRADSEPIDNCCYRSNVGLAQARADWVWGQLRHLEWAKDVHWVRLPGGPQSPGDPASPVDRSVAVHVCWQQRPERAAVGAGGDCGVFVTGGRRWCGIATASRPASAIPAAILGLLGDKNDLGLHGGLIDDGGMALVERGVVTGAAKTSRRGQHVVSMALFDKVAAHPQIVFVGPT